MTNPRDLTRKTLLFYWQKAWKYPGYVIGILIAAPLALLMFRFLPPLVAANILQRISDGELVRGDLWQSFGPQLLLYTGLVMLGGIVLWRIVIILIWKLEMRVLQDIYHHVFSHLVSMSADFHANRFGGSLVSQTNKLAGAYIRLADTFTFQTAALVLSFIFTIIILAPRAPLLVAVLLVFSILFLITAVLITKRVRQLNALEAAASNRQTGYLADVVTNIMAVKSFAASGRERVRYQTSTDDTRKATEAVMRASIKRDIFFSGSTTSLTAASLIIAVAGVVLTNSNIETVFLAVTYTGIIGENLWQFSQNTLRNYNRALGDAKDMIETLDIPPSVTDPAHPQKSHISRGSIRFDAVRFAHTGSNSALFESLTLVIKPGEKVGLVGPSGSGKTTLTRVLLRYSDIQDGAITIDSQNIAHISQNDLRRSIAYVPQEPLLFHRSIRENIAYGRQEATLQEVKAIARRANASEFIELLPDGYDTLVGERGVKLSGGQRQRIAIARAMLKNAPILVLDEATSALDSESEVLIQDALWKLMENRTAIVIAHRLSTIQKMDRIIVMDKGSIVEQGSHKELIHHDGTYARLWAHQSDGFIED